MEQNQTSSPEKVKTAIKLLYLSLGVGVLESTMEALMHTRMASPAFIILITFSVLGIMWLNIFMIGRGRNWARITFLVLFIIGLPFFILGILKSLPSSPIFGLLGIGQAVIQTVALVYLFQRASSVWFREIKEKN